MAQENVELARQVFRAVNRRDLDAFLNLMDPAVEALPRQASMQGGCVGHTGMGHWWVDVLDVFPDFAIEVVEVRDLGDTTLGELRYRGRGADSASPFNETVWQVSEWRDGKTVWWATYETRDEALEAIRLRE